MWKAARYHKGIALSLAEMQQQKESVYGTVLCVLHVCLLSVCFPASVLSPLRYQ